MARLGKVNLIIESEGDNSSIEATSYPAEKGIPYTDHVQEKPDEFTLSGYIIGKNYQSDKEYLKKEMKKGTIMTYVGRNIAKNVIILSIDGNVDSSIANGSAISIKLQTIRIANTSWVSVKNSGKKKPVSKKTTTAVYHVTRRGDTYWELSKKYGTSIAQLRAWNKYPDKKIPVGVKLRVK
ncbi:LysM domain-containing protein [Bacillus methanolicus]|uniref:lytic transglycosylase n=1 Tax=Bacillus methanolicus TaxID=1471 RepID=UPI00238061BB|nr:LysM peptidoglycan-binding domain-containing protein [Bacillus methanolicus]MDE3837939.1 LysM domain-containing protein [Bacillus methanolicus]